MKFLLYLSWTLAVLSLTLIILSVIAHRSYKGTVEELRDMSKGYRMNYLQHVGNYLFVLLLSVVYLLSYYF